MSNPKEVLKKFWGYSEFRKNQEEIIISVLEGKDTLAILPTGGGKSICFQVPAIILQGVCLVVTPLIALMKDQVENLKKRGVSAACIHSGLSYREIDIILDNSIYGDLKFLYLSPERLKSELFLERVKKMKIGLIAVDEAHCISQWGYDFRPSYLEIVQFLKLVPQVPLIALTASATEEVQTDIIEKLEFHDPCVIKGSFLRENLSYSIFYQENKETKLLEILTRVKGAAIIYVRNRRKTREVAHFLNRRGIYSEYYHAGLTFAERSDKQNRWINNQARVMVATNAFGMGIDKPDVRVVVHLDLPENLESYYQEAGRAGRDGRKSFAVILYNQYDLRQLFENINESYPEVDFLKTLYQSLANYLKIAAGSSLLASFDFDLDEFTENFKLPKRKAYHGLKRMEEQGLIEFSESFFSPSKLMVAVSNEELYRFQVKNESLDKLIKAILRIYGGGVFSTYTFINENLLARNLKVNTSEIRIALKNLHKNGVIFYEEQKNLPQIVFLTPRLDANYIPIDKKFLKERKSLEISKAESVKKFIENTSVCRAYLISQYFGENSDVNCGVCDICLEKNKVENDIPLQYEQKILDLLQEDEYFIEDLVNQIDPQNPDLVLNRIRKMLDIELIKIDSQGKLRI